MFKKKNTNKVLICQKHVKGENFPVFVATFLRSQHKRVVTLMSNYVFIPSQVLIRSIAPEMSKSSLDLRCTLENCQIYPHWKVVTFVRGKIPETSTMQSETKHKFNVKSKTETQRVKSRGPIFSGARGATRLQVFSFFSFFATDDNISRVLRHICL